MRKKFIVSIMMSMLVALSLVQAILSNSLSTTGIALARLENEVVEYKRQNALLHELILNETSLTKIASKAATFGYTPGSSQIVVSGSVPIAAKP